jgi:putative alpha-1,2-mannosidase
MHESGTGGSPKYGVVSQMPLTGSVDNPLIDLAVTRSSADVGSPGYYKTSLASGVQVELAASSHVGYFQYTFPAGQNSSVLVDVSHFLPSNRGGGLAQAYSNGNMQVYPDGHYEGSGTYHGGWNLCKSFSFPLFC